MRHPIQPLEKDSRDRVRFKENAIVRYLLDTHPNVDMDALATLPFSVEDRQQFAQLIGYSYGGYCELSYVDQEACDAATRLLEQIC